MKTLVMTAALGLSMATAAWADGHTAGFMEYTLSKEDLLASEMIGMRVYSAEKGLDADTPLTSETQADWDDIGEINELVLSPDGTVLAVIVGVGGFLGLGEKDVAVDMKQIGIIREADDADDFFLVIRSSAAALEAAPVFDRGAERGLVKPADPDADRGLLRAPVVDRDGYARAEKSELTTEMLTGARVLGVENEDVGEIHSLLVDADGQIDRAIIDVGGFLGLGEKQVAVTFEELTILRQEDGDDVQVYIDASQDALEAQPAYKE